LRLLLDTHIWIWSVLEPEKLSRRVQQELENRENQCWLSPVSTWEALTLYAKGRFRIHGAPREWVMRAAARLQEAPLTHEIVIVAQELPLPHQDPADRFLAATAHVLGLTLVTADRHLLGLGAISTLANR
jgi:PIN domain nuclease of toxin-antitoxin system